VAEAEILDAASELLAESDFRDLTVSAVMERTGMKRAAFYNYFADRNDLVIRLLARIEHEMMAASSLWLEDRGGGPARFREAMSEAIGVFARHGHVIGAAHAASFHDQAVERHYRHAFLQAFIDAVALRIRAENRAGRAAVPDPERVAEALVLMNATVLSERLGRPAKERPEPIGETIILIWLRVIYGRDIQG
jgi:TetR/AcrR family transcriptional regulator, ethionamide resistance regulator